MTSVSTDRRQGVNAGAAIKVPCQAATTAAITLSGEQTVDGVALVTGNRCLVKNQASGVNNGIYTVDTGTWTRSPDFDGTYDVLSGTLVYITGGTVSAGLFYTLSTANTITIGTTSLAFAALSGGTSITIPLPATQGGTGGGSATAGLSSLGVVQVTAEAGTANAQTGTIDALVTAYRADQLFLHTPSVSNTGALTITYTPSGSGALAAKNVFSGGAALVGGEFRINVPTLLHYDGTQLNIVGHLNINGLTQKTKPVRTADFLGAYDAAGAGAKKILLDDVPLPRSHLAGYTLSNNVADATNDVDIAVGSARSTANTDNILLASALTKQLDAVWAVGTNAGGRASGAAIANTTYHVFAIKRPDTGVVDVAFDTSASGANIAANTNSAYTEIRRIGSILRESAAIAAFSQVGDEFLRSGTLALDISTTALASANRTLFTILVPLGVKVIAKLAAQHVGQVGGGGGVLITSPDQADTASSSGPGGVAQLISTNSVSDYDGAEILVRTNTSAQIGARSGIANGTLYSTTLGWIDRRGRDD